MSIVIKYHIKLEVDGNPVMNWPGSCEGKTIEATLKLVAKEVRELNKKAEDALEDYLNGQG